MTERNEHGPEEEAPGTDGLEETVSMPVVEETVSMRLEQLYGPKANPQVNLPEDAGGDAKAVEGLAGGEWWADAKVLWTILVWLLYGGLLGWRTARPFGGRRAAVLAVAAFAMVLVGFFAEDLIWEGFHARFLQ